MKKAVLALLVFGAVNVAQASDGIDKAYEFCQSLSFSSDQMTCADKVGEANYIDEQALFVCSTLSFSSDKISCIETIKDKQYRPAEIHLCQEQSFSSSRIECLEKRGTSFDGGVCASSEKISRRIGRVIELLDNYEVNRARQVLMRLRERLAQCD